MHDEGLRGVQEQEDDDERARDVGEVAARGKSRRC